MSQYEIYSYKHPKLWFLSPYLRENDSCHSCYSCSQTQHETMNFGLISQSIVETVFFPTDSPKRIFKYSPLCMCAAPADLIKSLLFYNNNNYK